MYNKLVAELVMGRVGYVPSLYGPSWLWAEFVMGRVCYGPRCPVTGTNLDVLAEITVRENHYWKSDQSQDSLQNDQSTGYRSVFHL